ncbi:hypothetical protein [Yoonia algicola]|uniref:Uncharacterized protein n=1 Tax=Yoonia algicola TaxID=3137368 RepID=A0AAN0M5R4_9RHOB
MEALFAIVIVSLAAGGIGLGLALGRGPARTSCGAADRLAVGRCADCPLRRRGARKEQT